MFQTKVQIKTQGKGLYPVTSDIERACTGSLPEIGLLNVFIQHTSASLIIQENADPSAKQDLESFLERLIPDNQSWHRHTFEGEDDTTSHMKSALTQVSIMIPIVNSRLALGTWQGVFLWEHRKVAHMRTLILTTLGA